MYFKTGPLKLDHQKTLTKNVGVQMFLVFECFQNSEAKFTKVRTLLEEKIVFVKLGESHPRYPEFGSCLHTENCLGF